MIFRTKSKKRMTRLIERKQSITDALDYVNTMSEIALLKFLVRMKLHEEFVESLDADGELDLMELLK